MLTFYGMMTHRDTHDDTQRPYTIILQGLSVSSVKLLNNIEQAVVIL